MGPPGVDSHPQRVDLHPQRVVWFSEDAQRASTTTDRESRCRVHESGYMVCLIAPVTNDNDVQDSQKLGSVCFKRGLVPSGCESTFCGCEFAPRGCGSTL
eukprot:6367077-Pyramimonas_sp.AAC.1